MSSFACGACGLHGASESVRLIGLGPDISCVGFALTWCKLVAHIYQCKPGRCTDVWVAAFLFDTYFSAYWGQLTITGMEQASLGLGPISAKLISWQVVCGPPFSVGLYIPYRSELQTSNSVRFAEAGWCGCIFSLELAAPWSGCLLRCADWPQGSNECGTEGSVLSASSPHFGRTVQDWFIPEPSTSSGIKHRDKDLPAPQPGITLPEDDDDDVSGGDELPFIP